MNEWMKWNNFLLNYESNNNRIYVSKLVIEKLKLIQLENSKGYGIRDQK